MKQHDVTTTRILNRGRLRAICAGAVLAIAAFSRSDCAWAADNNWVFTGGNPRWFVPTNWSLGVPTSGDDAFIGNGTTAFIEGVTPATAGNLFIERGGVTIGNVDEGTLTVGGELAVGAAGTPGTLTFNYGTISVNTLSVGANGTYSDTTYGNLILTGSDPTIKMAGGVNVVVNSAISGTNGLIKGGVGTLTLAGKNTYSGGTTIGVGTLQVGNGGTSGVLGSGDVNNDGTLAFNRSDSVVVSNLISGTGNLRQAGTGTIALTADNTYSGGTTISAGTLQVGNGGTTGAIGDGDVNNNGTLAFNRSDSVVVSNLISGSGNLKQAGAGTLTLTANNTYSGATIITNGTLQVGDGGTTGTLGTGNIADNAALVFNRSDGLFVNNSISGTGTVAQAGSGTLTLTANNTYSGGTTISAGTLHVGDGGTTGTLGSGAISNDAALVFNRSDTLVVGGAISGTGTLTQTGNGTLTLTGTNTYGGTTTISAGMVQVGNGGTTGTLGSGDVTNDGTLAITRSDSVVVSNLISGTGNLRQGGTGTVTLTADNTYSGETTISAGTLRVGDGGTTGALGSGTVSNNATLAFNRSDDIVVDNQISGSGSLTHAGAGTLILTATNTYSGMTTITNGTLQVGEGGTSGSLGSGMVSNNAALVFNRSDDVVVSNLVSGTGSLAKTGGGTLTLAADNTYSGITTITNGTLQVGNGGSSGSLGTNDVHNDGVLVFNRSGNIVIGNLISGFGSLTHAGTNALTLTATNTYSGGTQVENGGLLILRNGFALGSGNLDLLNGTLKADSSLTNGLTINVSGNYAQGADGTLVLRIGGTATTNFDQLNVTGTASLDGTGRVVAVNGYVPHHNDEAALVVAGGGVTGTFSTFTNEIPYSPLLDPQLTYNTNDVSLKWVQLSFVDYLVATNGLELTPNQMAVGRGLDSIVSSTASNDVALIDRLDYLPYLTNNLPVAFDLIAPEELSSMFVISFSGMDAQGYRFLKRINELRADYRGLYSNVLNRYFPGGGEAASSSDDSTQPSSGVFNTPEDKLWDIYAEAIGESVDVRADANASGYNLFNGGLTIGVDRRLSDQIVVGAAASYANGRADLVYDGRIDVDSVRGQLYAAWFRRGLHIEGMIGGGFNSYDTRREALDGVARGSTDGFEWTGLVGGGYDWQHGAWSFGPQAVAQYMQASINGFTEDGSLAPLRIESQSAKAMHTQLGAHLRYRAHVPETWTFITPEVYLAWRHDLLDKSIALDSRFASGEGDVFTVHGPEQGSDSVVAGVGVAVQWKPTLSAYLNYSTQLGRSGYGIHAVAVGVRLGF